MPVYDITDERTGRKFKLEGDSEPTELELEEIFASQSEPEQPQLPAGSIATPPRGFAAVPDILTNPLDQGRGVVAGWSEPMEQQNESFPKLLADVGAGTVGAGMELMDKGVTGALNLPTTAANYIKGQAPGMAGYTEPRFKAGESVFNLFDEFTPEELAQMSPGEQRAAGVASAVGKSANMLTTPGNLATLPLITGKLAKPVASAILGNVALSEPAAIERAYQSWKDPNTTPFEAAEAFGEAAVVNPTFAALLGSQLRTPKGPAPAPRLSPEIEAAAAKGGSPVRRLGLKIPEGEFAQPGILPLADAALREAQSPIQVPGRTPAIELLRNELQPPTMDLIEPTKAVGARGREAGESIVKPTLEGVKVEPGFERTASDMLQERDRTGALKPREGFTPARTQAARAKTPAEKIDIEPSIEDASIINESIGNIKTEAGVRTSEPIKREAGRTDAGDGSSPIAAGGRGRGDVYSETENVGGSSLRERGVEGSRGEAKVPVIIERVNAKDRRDWTKLPSSFEQDAVRAAYNSAKELFPKKAISQRVRASKASTFKELRSAIDEALSKYRPELKSGESPIRETITPASDNPIGNNAAGEKLYQRKDGSVYRIRMDRKDRPSGYPDFGGDLAQADASLRVTDENPIASIESQPISNWKQQVADSGFKDQTQWSYEFAEKNPNATSSDLLAAKQRALEAGKAAGFPDQGMKMQFFSEAAKWRQALDAAKKLENPSKEQLGAIEQEIGVGGMDRGAELQAALKREGESLKAEPKTYEITEPPTLQEAQSIASNWMKENPGGLKIKIADDYQGMPDAAHQAAYRQGANPVGIKAFVNGREVWLNRQMHDNAQDLTGSIWHEQFGHFATDKKLGPKRIGRFMSQVHDSFAKDPLMDDVRSRYTKADKTRLGREFVARVSENPNANPSAWKRIVAMVRQWLRDIGFVKTVTENDIQSLLRGAMDSLKKQEAGMSPDDISLSLKSAADAANERFPSAKPNKPGVAPGQVSPSAGGQPGAPIAQRGAAAPPPTGRPPIAAAAGGAQPGRTPVTLDDIYKIFEPEKKASPTLKQRAVNIAEAFRTGVSSKFRPVNKLAEDIAKSYGLGKPKDIAGIMEQLKGSQGKGEADVFRFDRDVAKLVKGNEKDFNAYMFLRRSLDRLEQDAADVAAGGKPRRSVSQYTPDIIGDKIRALEAKVGPDKLRAMENAARQYQKYMDDALRLQVESGRMSQEVYNEIKAGNQFYAPFKVMKYLEESSKPAGAGKRIDTTADFTKAMEGIEDPDFKLGDMLGAARQGILMSRILADKNTAMRNIAELSAFDTRGDFIKKLAPTADAPRGWEAVNVFENGKQNRYAVQPEVAEAIQLYGGNAGGVISRALSYSSIPFRAGATALNIPFQISNLLADQPRAALISKYGLRNVNDLINYPMDFVHALFASVSKDVFGVNSKLMFDFLDSGVAGTTVQEYLTPDALKFREPSNISKSRKLASSVINTLPNFAQAIEQVSKVMGVKRAMRFEGVTDGKQLAKQVPEAITELRRFSGSPDFGRQGKWVEQARLNLLYMFLNARIQGTVADVGRLAGRDGKGTAAQTWAKIGAAVGIPTAYLYMLNQRPEFKEDYDSRPADEKRNYWLIPKDSFIVNDDGEKMRDYWRIPKREVSKWVANLTETALDFAKQRDPENLMGFGEAMIEEISPVNITGETAQERLESIGASLNPLVKAPLEFAMGRDMYRHKEIMSDQMSKASPEMQFTPRTAEAFKKLANAMPDIAPDVLRSPLMLENLTRNMTAGLITQFMPRKPVEGRSGWENNPLLARFQAVPYKDNSEFRDEVTQLEREAADEQLNRHRTATKLLDDNKGLDLAAIVEKAPRDERLIKHMADLWVAKENGITGQERQLLALPVRQRAAYIANKLRGLDAAQKDEMIMDLGRKRILTEAVFQELGQLMEAK
jgi:hypothetical protein